MLFKLLNGLVLNVDNVLFYTPYTIRDYFGGTPGDMEELDTLVDMEFDDEDLFSSAELDALAELVKAHPETADSLVIVYAANMPGKGLVWLRKDEFKQIVGNLRSQGTAVVDAKETLLDDLKGL